MTFQDKVELFCSECENYSSCDEIGLCWIDDEDNDEDESEEQELQT